MKILVAVKRVIDHRVQVRVKADHSDIEQLNVKMSINPFDEIALEEAVRLKEKGVASDIVVVTIGCAAAQDVLRHALALGADRAILIELEQKTEPLWIAQFLKAIIDQEQPQMVLLGKQAIDDDANQTGQMLAALTGWAQGTFISQLTIRDEHTIEVVREVDEGLETLQLRLPVVLTADLRLNEPRYITLPHIIKSKKKPLTIVDAKTFGIPYKIQQKVLKVVEPEKRKAQCQKLNNAVELIQKLRDEAKVLQ